MGILLLLLASPLWAQSFEAWSAKAQRAEKKGDAAAALQFWSNALFKWKPSDGKKARARALGARAALQNDPEAALKDLTEALKNDPKDPRLAHRRGRLLLERGQPQAALADFYAATKLDLSFGQAYLDRGRAYELLGDRAFAFEDYRTACQLGVKEGCGKKGPPKLKSKPKKAAVAARPEAPPPPPAEEPEPAEPEPAEEPEPALGTQIEGEKVGAGKDCVAELERCAAAEGATYDACVTKAAKCPESCVRKFKKALNTQSEAQAFREVFGSGRPCD